MAAVSDEERKRRNRERVAAWRARSGDAWKRRRVELKRQRGVRPRVVWEAVHRLSGWDRRVPGAIRAREAAMRAMERHDEWLESLDGEPVLWPLEV